MPTYKKAPIGKGWHRDSKRHRQAKLLGRAEVNRLYNQMDDAETAEDVLVEAQDNLQDTKNLLEDAKDDISTKQAKKMVTITAKSVQRAEQTAVKQERAARKAGHNLAKKHQKLLDQGRISSSIEQEHRDSW